METGLFDVTANPGSIQPAWGFHLLFAIVAAGMLFVAVWRIRRGLTVGRVAFGAFAAIWTTIFFVVGGQEIRSVLSAREELELGHIRTLEGCVQDFKAGARYPGRGTGSDETWRIGDHEFSYRRGGFDPGYSQVEPMGGIVHADSWARVSFVRDHGKRRPAATAG